MTVPGVKSPMMLLNTNLTHRQALELFLLLRELWAVLFTLFRQNPCSQVGFFVPRLGSPKAQRFFPIVTSDLEMPVHWESELFLGCHSLMRESETSLCAHEGCG